MAPTHHLEEPTNSKIEYVIFDMDGLIIDSETIYTEVTNKILAPYGVEMTWEIKSGLMGKPEHEAADHLLSFFPSIPLDAPTYIAERRTLQDLAWRTVPPLPGARRLIKHLHDHGIPIALATGSTRQAYDIKSAHLEDTVFKYFPKENIVCGDDVRLIKGRSKPCPDIFLLAAQTLGLKVGDEEIEALSDKIEGDQLKKLVRARGLIFEDAILGVSAAKRAGMHVIWVPDAHLKQLPEANAMQPEQELASLEEFKPELWGLPPYKEEQVTGAREV